MTSLSFRLHDILALLYVSFYSNKDSAPAVSAVVAAAFVSPPPSHPFPLAFLLLLLFSLFYHHLLLPLIFLVKVSTISLAISEPQGAKHQAHWMSGYSSWRSMVPPWSPDPEHLSNGQGDWE